MSVNNSFILFSSLLAVLGSAAHADLDKAATEGEIARAYSDFSASKGDRAAARKELNAQLAKFPGDSETWAALGSLQVSEKDWKGADESYARAAQNASQAKSRATWLKKQADTAEKLGDAPRALALRQQATDLLAADVRAEAEKSARPMAFAATARTGYDTNVLLVSDSLLNAQNISGQSSFLVGADASASGSSVRSGGELRYGGGASANWYTGEKASQFSVVAAQAGAKYENANLGLVSTDFGVVFLNRSGLDYYNFSGALAWEKKLNATPAGVFFFGARFKWQDFADPISGAVPSQDRDGPAIAARARLETKLPHGQLLSTALELEGVAAAGDEYKAFVTAVQTAWSKPLTAKDRVLAGFRIGRTSYTSHPQNRGDWAIFIAPAWSRKLGDSDSATLGYVFNLNRSNLSEAQYTKHAVLFQVTHEIL